MRSFYFVITVLILTGCSTLKGADYDRGTTAPEEYEKAVAGCEMETKKYTAQKGSSSWTINDNYNDMFDTCMRSKGYKRR